MSLFICELCGVIENTNLVNKDYKDTVENYIGLENQFYPNLHLLEMQGHGNNIFLNNKLWKAKKEIKMLCSLCNTGEHHGEFERNQATANEIEVASYSVYNYTTGGTHENGALVHYSDNWGSHNEYTVNNVYRQIHNIYEEVCGAKKTDQLSNLKIEDSLLRLVYDVYIEDPHNIDLYHFYGDVDWKDERSVALYIVDSIILPEESKSITFVNLYRKHVEPLNVSDPLLNIVPTNTKKHWKETQSLEDKEARLDKAEAKRIRKLLHKVEYYVTKKVGS